MKPAGLVRNSLLFAVTIGSLACLESHPGAPVEGLEPIAVEVVRTRAAGAGEPRSAIVVSGGQRSVTIQVTTPAMCATRVDAEASRTGGEINVVARVDRGDLTYDCFFIPENLVVDYVGTVSGIPAGSYRVNVFETRGSSGTRFLGSAVVAVPAG